MIDGRPAVEQVQVAFTQAITEVCAVHGIPMLRVKKRDLPTVAYFLHTNTRLLRASLSLIWAVDHRPREARYKSIIFSRCRTQRLAATRDGSPRR